MPNCIFVSDLHGSKERYNKLFRLILKEKPTAVFIGGDLLPHAMHRATDSDNEERDFLTDVIAAGFKSLRRSLQDDYPLIYVILGNDDPRSEEAAIEDIAREGIWLYIHGRWAKLGQTRIYGYAHVPPTPFQLKDWDRYDVSRYVDPGCISPEEGRRSVQIPEREKKHSTIRKDLAQLEDGGSFDDTIFLFHTPPYKTKLDRAALDGKMVDHAPLDVHVGSIAVREFIEKNQPLITLHGHIHESSRMTGQWQDKIGRTFMFSAAHDGPELAVVQFDPENPQAATRELL